MNFLSMKYFCAVEKERSITKAAEILHITQQTLSAHIATIEKEVGCLLFLRHTPLELTYAGTVFLGYAKRFERLNHSMEKEFADIRSDESGTLRIGIAHTRGRAIMPDLISRHQNAYPKMQIDIVEASNDILRQRLISRELDLIIANFPEDIPEIESRFFYDEEIVLLISHFLLNRLYGDEAKDIIQTVREQCSILALSECPFLLGSQKDIAGRIGNRMITEAEFIPIISTRSGNIETLLELCAKGKGACFCPEILARRTLTEHILSSLEVIRFGDLAHYQIRLGWLRQEYCWQGIANFVDVAMELTPDLIKDI